MLPPLPGRRARARAGVLVALACIAATTGCATGDWRHTARSWAERGGGALLAFGLHESCHLALGAAMGADISGEMHWNGPHLLFGNLSDAEHRAVAVAGNACTALAAEVVVDTGLHRKSDVAWGMAAFHSVNAFGYAFSSHGDSEHWRDFGGSSTAWQAMNATHASRIGAHLAWDAGLGTRVMRWWRGPEAELPVPGEPGPEPEWERPAPQWEWPEAGWSGLESAVRPVDAPLGPLRARAPRSALGGEAVAALAPATARPPWIDPSEP